ncbi:MAG: helix-turn-helix transcriptional regulator [Chitinophagaceae bacterium]
MSNKSNIQDKREIYKFIQVSPFPPSVRITDPNKFANYFAIFYVSKGKGIFSIGQNNYQIKAPVFFFLRKGQVHHWNISNVSKGYVLVIKKVFVEKSYDSELKTLLSRLNGLTSLQIKKHKTIEQLFELLEMENNFTIVEGLLKALSAKTFDIIKQDAAKTNRTSHLFQSYRNLLSKKDELKNSVSHYAKQLNTSPQNLNSICRKAVNQSAASILSEYIMGEAKQYLYHTGNTVSEIAFSLGFNDPSHFVKYFKRLTGLTPRKFRGI